MTSIKNGTAVNIRVFNINDCHHMDLFVRIKQIEDPDVPLRDVSLSHMTSMRALLCIYSFDYSAAQYQ